MKAGEVYWDYRIAYEDDGFHDPLNERSPQETWAALFEHKDKKGAYVFVPVVPNNPENVEYGSTKEDQDNMDKQPIYFPVQVILESGKRVWLLLNFSVIREEWEYKKPLNKTDNIMPMSLKKALQRYRELF